MSQLINIFLEPGKVFAGLKDKPGFLLPYLVVALLGAVAATLYFFNVDPEWYGNYQLMAAGQEMSKAELEQAKQFMPGARTLGYFMWLVPLVSMALIYAVYALYYMLAGKITGNPTSFRHGLSLTAWSGMPMLLTSVLMIIGIYTSSPQTPIESLQMLSFDPLFVQLELGNDWLTLARSFSLIYLWVWFLAALGWKTWYRTGWGQALFVVLLPNLLYFGVLALFAAF